MCGAIVLPGVSLGELIRTPWQGEGPFYPDRIPEDTDNDLVKNGHSTIEAGGKILNLKGSLVNRDSKPIKGMVAEIWQTDMNGVYLHTGSFGSKMRDDQFQGFGRSRYGGAGDDLRGSRWTADDRAPVWLQGSLGLGVVRNSLAARLDHSVASGTLHVLAHRHRPALETALARYVIAVVHVHVSRFIARLKSIAALRRPILSTQSLAARPTSRVETRYPSRKESS